MTPSSIYFGGELRLPWFIKCFLSRKNNHLLKASFRQNAFVTLKNAFVSNLDWFNDIKSGRPLIPK